MKKKLFGIIVFTLISSLWLVTLTFGQIRQQDSSRRADYLEPPLKLKTEIVNLTVTVTDRRNVTVPGLEAHHFQVYEDNAQQQVEYFRCEDEPLSIGIIFDLSGSMKKKLPHSREAVNIFMQASHQDDDFFLLGFNQQCELMADFGSADSITDRLEATKAEGKTALSCVPYGSVEIIGLIIPR